MLARQETPTRSHVELTPLSPTTWRVCDDRFESGDLRYIVGYLHTIDDGYEMLWMRPHPGVVYRHPTSSRRSTRSPCDSSSRPTRADRLRALTASHAR